MVDKKQIRSWIQKQKQLINETQEEKSRDYIVMMWLGYLNGLRLTNAITVSYTHLDVYKRQM